MFKVYAIVHCKTELRLQPKRGGCKIIENGVPTIRRRQTEEGGER